MDFEKFEDMFGDPKLSSMRKRLRTLQRVQISAGASRARTNDEIHQLEIDLSRALLLVHSMYQLCLKKGVFTEVELEQMMQLLDAQDGESDGLLDLNSTRPPDEREDTGPANTPEEHLRNIEREARRQKNVSPEAFFKAMEDQDS